ncbi:2Fe-2S iron-sulfur cluster binding domain-containing protein [Vineibacter terrae]|uniref:2Fe-2S iron-sulfur cluster binding domain-containing protein n=1 Tax=Vineibacter terrae TaxID=2586908 RepID=A0A5C8P9N5_9HYPH|nr:phenol 2-monooxygenase domain-containing protein [Vineibacter terrae]TXL70244.1 2Fe-2S iron-sulfur cluster binding domain-containing protein [Vineibacter terrae]
MGYQVTIEPLGHSIEVEEGQTILDASLRAGVYLPHACCHGLCGTCKVQVVSGEFDHGPASPFALMDVERDEGRCLACCATPTEDMVIEADIDEDPDARHLPLQDHLGRVAELVDLTPTIKGVFIDVAGDEVVFQAGQYVNLHLPGLEHPRAFSLSNQPRPGGRLELNVRHVPNGEGTTYVHRQLRVGDEVRISGPLGRFYVRKSDSQPVIFMAGGSGLSSPRSMILDMLETDADSRPITLIYGARNRAELYYHDLFLDLAMKHPNFRYVPALNEPTPACGWDGIKGFVHDAAKATFDNDFRGHKAYLCGPPVMIEACIRTLMQGRLFERDIYTEKFVTAGDGAQALARSPLFKNL